MRRSMVALLSVLALGGATAAAAIRPAPAAPLPKVVVYKSASCGCCSKWVDYIKAAGFPVEVHDVDDIGEIAAASGVPSALGSCHTALVQGYVIEGHVPADLIQKLLTEKPKLAGLSVPGMVVGSPGMDGNPAQKYDVVSWTSAGKTAVYAKR
jgi:hypothetical protein